MKTTNLIAVFTIFSLYWISCRDNTTHQLTFETLDTDFSKGRLAQSNKFTLHDVATFHGHLCDGLVVGAIAFNQAMKTLYPNKPIDRTNLRVVSKPSPCLADVGIYLSGGRYQFNTFYIKTDFSGIYIIQRLDNLQTVSVSLKKGVKPTAIDSLGNLATKQLLSPCGIDSLRKLEDDFTTYLLKSNPDSLFLVKTITDFIWEPELTNDHKKSDIINKSLPKCIKH